MYLRRATTDDIPTIRNLAHQIWREHYPEIISHAQIDWMLDAWYNADTLRQQLIDPQIDFWMVEDPAPQGYIAFQRQGPGQYYLQKFYLDVRGKGLGSRVFRRLIEAYPDIEFIRLNVNRRNFRSVNFYYKMGFQVESVMELPVGPGYVMDDFVMIWRPTKRVMQTVPLVLLHGFCEDASVWDDWRALLPKNIPVLALDLPGFGSAPLTAESSLEAYAKSVEAQLQREGVERCVMIGHSMGGYTALTYARKYRNRLAGLGLFHSHPFADTPDRIEGRRRGIDMVMSGKRDLYVAQLFPNLFSEKYKTDHPEILEKLIANGRRQSPEGIAGALKAMMDRPDQSAVFPAFTFPVLALLGREDALVPAVDTLAAASTAPVADVHLLPQTAHMGMFEAPEITAKTVSDFWNFCTSQL